MSLESGKYSRNVKIQWNPSYSGTVTTKPALQDLCAGGALQRTVCPDLGNGFLHLYRNLSDCAVTLIVMNHPLVGMCWSFCTQVPLIPFLGGPPLPIVVIQLLSVCPLQSISIVDKVDFSKLQIWITPLPDETFKWLSIHPKMKSIFLL